MERLRKSPEQLLLALNEQAQKAKMEPWLYDPSILIWPQPASELMRVFGFSGELRVLYSKGRRDIPGIVTYQEFPRDHMVRMKVSNFYFGGAANIEVGFNSQTGELLYVHREGNPYPAQIHGSRWYHQDLNTLLDHNPEFEGRLSDEQQALIESGKAKLVDYFFIPHNDRASWRYGEGSASIIYLWNKEDNNWSYVAHSERGLGMEADEADFYKAAGRDMKITIEPFGRFRIPRVVLMSYFLEHVFFPRLEDEVSADSAARVLPTHEFIGIRRVS